MAALKFYYFYQNIFLIHFSEQFHPTCKRQEEKGEEKKTENFQKAILNNPKSNIKIKKQAAHSYRKMLT